MRLQNMRISRLLTLLSTGALISLPTLAATDGCAPGEINCDGGGIVVTMPAGANTDRSGAVPDLSLDGFEITVDGAPVAQDGTISTGPPRRASRERRQDLALAKADIAVKFDGLDVHPRLALGALGGEAVRPGSRVTLINQMNYPAFVVRGELRTIDVDARGRASVISTVPLEPNAQVSITAPDAATTRLYTYRVYDARGRYDETQPVTLDDLMGRGAPTIAVQDGTAVEEGIDTTVTSRIPVYGGAVTVSGRNVGRGRAVQALGENLRADDQGSFVVQRILPTGDHLVQVDVTGGQSLARDITVPAHDLFYVGIVDVTLGRSLENELQDATGGAYDETYQRGRVAFYLKGKVKGNVLLTAALDTGEDDLDNLLRNLDEKNPRSLIDRIDPDEFYPVYGDDSTSINDAPTAGKLYVRLEKDNSHAVWGTFKAQVGGTEYLRNERTLYGAQGVYRSPAQTINGQPRVEAQLYAAQPDTLPQRDSFLGTGGSVYFLRFQDISRGSETIQVEVQDPDTGRVISRRTLVYGVDYDINYVQGLVTLRRPLSGTADDGNLVVGNPSGDNEVFLVATYEHTPTVSEIDSFSYGGRVQVWADDNWRLGITAQREDLGTTDQTAYGADILYQPSERTFFSFEYARTDGVGLDQTNSLDGGLTLDTDAGIAGDGRAVRFEGQADLQELGFATKGLIGAYFEDRSAGFSTLSYRSANDEQLYGVFAEVEPSDRWAFRLDFDHFEDATGKRLREGSLTAAYHYSDRVTLKFGVEHIDEIRPGFAEFTGTRTDLGLRADIAQNDRLSWYGYAQGTVDRSGGLARNNRVGLGAAYRFSDTWSGELELSDGTTGTGALAKLAYADAAGNTTYFGYTLDPNRALDGLRLSGRDRGRFVLGATRKINERLSYSGENSYDLFGQRKSLTSTYGAEYAITERLTFDGALEMGRVRDRSDLTEFDRTALSFGARYQDDRLTWRGRLELRRDEGLSAGSNRDADTIAGSFSARYKIDDASRLLFSVEGIKSENATASIPDAEFAELTFGYAFRPVDNDRLNLLAKYQFIYDMTERAGVAPSGGNFVTTPRQKAHILSLDASYDLNRNWTLGGKVGGRLSEQDDGAGFVSNDATLGVINLRYHAVHKWDFLIEARQLNAQDVGTQTGFMGAAYRHFGNNLKVGIGYNAGRFSDDLADVTYNDKGLFLNIVGKF